MSLPIPEHLVERLKAQTDLKALISDLTGAQFRGNVCPCPLHKGEGNNFSVYRKGGEQKFKCHSQCGASGDVYGFIVAHRGLRGPDAFLEAVRWLADRQGVRIPEPEEQEQLSREEQELRSALGLLRDCVGAGDSSRSRFVRIPPLADLIARLRTHGVGDRTLGRIGLLAGPVQECDAWVAGGPGAAEIGRTGLQALAPLVRGSRPIGRYGLKSGGYVTHGSPEVSADGNPNLEIYADLEGNGRGRWTLLTSDPEVLKASRDNDALPLPGFAFGGAGVRIARSRTGGTHLVVVALASREGRRRIRRLALRLAEVDPRCLVGELEDSMSAEQLIRNASDSFDWLLTNARREAEQAGPRQREGILRYLLEQASSGTGSTPILRAARLEQTFAAPIDALRSSLEPTQPIPPGRPATV